MGGWGVPPFPDDPSVDRIGGRLLPIRPMSISDILDGAFRGLRATFLPVTLLVVALIGPLQLALNLALSRIAPDVFGMGIFPDFETLEDPMLFEVQDIAALFGVTTIAAIAAFVISLLVSVAVVSLILQVDRGEEPDIRASITRSGRTLLVTLGATVLGGLIAGVGFAAYVFVLVMMFVIALPLGIIYVLLSIPVLVIVGSAYMGFANALVPIAVVEQRGVIETMQRAFWVVRTRFWRVVGLMLLITLLTGIVASVVQVPFMILAMFTGGFAWVVQSVGEVLGQIIAIPVTVFTVLLIYLDARVRLEGLDLQLRARTFGRS